MTFPRRLCHIPKLKAWFVPPRAQRRLHEEGFCEALVRHLKEKPPLFAESIGGLNPGADDRGCPITHENHTEEASKETKGTGLPALGTGTPAWIPACPAPVSGHRKVRGGSPPGGNAP